MIRMFTSDALKTRVQNSALYIQAVVLVAAGFAPMLLTNQVGALQLTSRKVTIGTSQVSVATTNDFQFTIATTGNIGSIEFLYCTTPLGTCTAPTGMSATAATLTGTTGITGFTIGTNTANSVRISKATPTSVAAATVATVAIANVTNPSTANVSFYPRITTYSDSAFTSVADTGIVAASTAQQLTVNGRVQERLEFCVAAVGDGGATDTTLFADTTGCAATTTTVVDLGVITNSAIARSPVNDAAPTSLGNDFYGIAMLNTNAFNGVSVTYFAENGTGTNQIKSFRVPGASCNGDANTLTDQCFRSATHTSAFTASAAGTGGTAFTAGTENFGMNVPCIIGGANTTPVTSTTTNLTVDDDFDSEGTTTSSADCENTDAGTRYAWNDTTTATPIAQSPTVVDDEVIKLNFAATASATTPTGSYTVKSTYIATPTF